MEEAGVNEIQEYLIDLYNVAILKQQVIVNIIIIIWGVTPAGSTQRHCIAGVQEKRKDKKTWKSRSEEKVENRRKNIKMKQEVGPQPASLDYLVTSCDPNGLYGGPTLNSPPTGDI